MSVDNTRKTMQAYTQALLRREPADPYLAEDVVLEMAGTDQVVQGREAVGQLLDALHRQTVAAHAALRSLVVADGQASAEFELIGSPWGADGGSPLPGPAGKVPYSVLYDLVDDQIRALRVYFPRPAPLQPPQLPTPEARGVATPLPHGQGERDPLWALLNALGQLALEWLRLAFGFPFTLAGYISRALFVLFDRLLTFFTSGPALAAGLW